MEQLSSVYSTPLFSSCAGTLCVLLMWCAAIQSFSGYKVAVTPQTAVKLKWLHVEMFVVHKLHLSSVIDHGLNERWDILYSTSW